MVKIVLRQERHRPLLGPHFIRVLWLAPTAKIKQVTTLCDSKKQKQVPCITLYKKRQAISSKRSRLIAPQSQIQKLKSPRQLCRKIISCTRTLRQKWSTMDWIVFQRTIFARLILRSDLVAKLGRPNNEMFIVQWAQEMLTISCIRNVLSFSKHRTSISVAKIHRLNKWPTRLRQLGVSQPTQMSRSLIQTRASHIR